MKQWAKQTQAGFTIVELLIVIVVIAILAAITIVSYNGIQNRANDSAVQSNMRSAGMRLDQYKSENSDKVPVSADWESFKIGISRSSYSSGFWNGSGYYNLLYCRNDQTFAIFGESKSGKVFKYVSGTGVTTHDSLRGSAVTCAEVGIPTSSTGYDNRWGYSAGAWTEMTK